MTIGPAIRATAAGCTISVRVHPGAKRNAVNGLHDGALKISVTAPPADDRANDALIGFAAERLGIPRARVHLISGAASRTKSLRIDGLSASEVETRLGSDLG